MFSTLYLVRCGCECLLPLVVLAVFPLIWRLGWFLASDQPPSWRLRPVLRGLLACLVVLAGWSLVAMDMLQRRNEVEWARGLQTEQVTQIVYFENYKVSDPQLISEMVGAIHDLEAADVGSHSSGVPFEIHLRAGKTRKWRAGINPRTGQVWIETESQATLVNPELDKVFKAAHFPL